MIKKTMILKVSAGLMVSCLIIDIILTVYVGSTIPNYSQLTCTLSSLGASRSPASNLMSYWWIFLGLTQVIFGFTIMFYYQFQSKKFKTTALLIIIYGIGEGFGSGIFKANFTPENTLTTSAIVHDILGGIGIAAILPLPLFINQLKTNTSTKLNKYPQIAFIIGLMSLLLFLGRYAENQNGLIAVYKGLWQRIFVLNSYIVLLYMAYTLSNDRYKHHE